MSSLSAAARKGQPVALLLPLTGDRARLGLSMRDAAMLAEKSLEIFDTRGTAQGARVAADAAMRRRPALILGPLLSEEVPAVAAAVEGRVPVIAFSNNAVLRTPGTFIFGITPAQVTSAVLAYARTRGVRSVAVLDDGSAWAAASSVAAGQAQGDLGVDIRILDVRAGGALPAAGDAPDAVLLPGSGEIALAAARQLRPTGIQLLATLQALDHRPSALEALDGAWIASPDPQSFGRFARAFEARHGGDPGAIAALAYDAAAIAHTLREAETLSREGLLAEKGFACITGTVRFRTDGSVARELAILLAGNGGYRPVAVSRGA